MRLQPLFFDTGIRQMSGRAKLGSLAHTMMSENGQTFFTSMVYLGGRRMTPTFYTQIESPLGPLLLAADDAGLRQILFVNGRHPARPESSWKEDRAPLNETIRQLHAYFAGDLENFDLKLAPEGTPFQLGVWR